MTRFRFWAVLGGLLVAGLALRLVLAFGPLGPAGVNGYGFAWDMSTFADWMGTIRDSGFRAYQVDPSINYPPAFADILGLLLLIGQLFNPADPTQAFKLAIVLLKLPAILADLGIAGVLAWAGSKWYSKGAGLWAAGLYLMIPVIWYDSAVWGQVDSIAALFMLLAVVLLVDRRPELAAVAAVLAVLIKPQGALIAIVLLPLLVGQLWRREIRWQRLLTALAAGLGSFAIVATPWSLRSYNTGWAANVPVIGDLLGLVQQAKSTAGLFQVLTANAFNVWQLVGDAPTATQYRFNESAWVPDDLTALGMPAYLLGNILFGLACLAAVWFLVRNSSPKLALTGYAFVLVAFFDLPTRVHERYLVQAFAVLALIWAATWLDRAVLVLVSLASLINLHAILATGLNVIFPPTQAPSDGTVVYQHHGQSPDFYGLAGVPFDAGFTREIWAVYASIAVHTLALAYLALQLWQNSRKASLA